MPFTANVGETVIDLNTGAKFKVADAPMELDQTKYGRVEGQGNFNVPKEARDAAVNIPAQDSHQKFMENANAMNAKFQDDVRNLSRPLQENPHLAGMTLPPPDQGPGAAMVHAVNAVPEAIGNKVGDLAAQGVEKITGPQQGVYTPANIVGSIAKEATQWFGPQVLSTGARLVGKGLASVLPGAQGGQMESLIGKTQEALTKGTEAARASETGYRMAANSIPATEMATTPNTEKVLDQIISEDKAHGLTTAAGTEAQRIKSLLAEKPRNLHWLNEEMTRIGGKTKAVLGQEAPDPRFKQLFAAMATDMETPATQTKTLFPKGVKSIENVAVQPSTTPPPSRVGTSAGYPLPGQAPSAPIVTAKTEFTPTGTPANVDVSSSGAGFTMREADRATRRTKGWEKLTDEFNDLVKMKRGQAGQQDINANQLLNKLKGDEYLKNSLTEQDWKEVTPLLQKLADTAVLPSPKGASFGSGRALTIGSLIGAPVSLAAGPAAGAMVGSGAAALNYGVGRLLMTQKGRSLVKAVLDSSAYEGSQKLNIVNGLARLAYGEDQKK